MDQLSSLESWKQHLELLESKTDKDNPKNFKNLGALLEHLSPITAPRLQKEYESCTIRSHKVFGEFFDEMDLSNKPLLSSFLRMLRSFGYFRIAQITYHVYGPGDFLNADLIYKPPIVKNKWYDLCPLLPEAGTIGWKSIMNHGLVREESELMQACIHLLTQKLHFYSIISLIEQFRDSVTIIRRNGEKVAKKLFELIRDIAFDDNSMIGIDSTLFDLLIPFTDQDQRAAVIEATVQDLFKPYFLSKPVGQEEIDEIYELIENCIMVKGDLQDILIKKMLEHLMHNVVRRKRRHSIESAQENEEITIEGLLNEIINGEKLNDLLPKMTSTGVSAKSIQTRYISYWILALDRILTRRAITANGSLKITASISSLLVLTSHNLKPDLIDQLSSTMAKAINNVQQASKMFAGLDHNTMIELTKVLIERTSLFYTFDSPILLFYKSYIRRCCACRGKPEAEKFSAFVTFICDKSLDKDTSHILQFIYINQIANFYGNTKIPETQFDGVKACSRRLYKFIKRKITHTVGKDGLNDQSEELSIDTRKGIAIEAFASILRIAIDQKDQDMLDSYGDLLAKLYISWASRIDALIHSVSRGKVEMQHPIDSQLSKLLSLYLRHKNMIEVYLDFDLVQKITSSLIMDKTMTVNGFSDGTETKSNKKLVYNELKSKLQELGRRAEKSRDVYQTIINKQYTSAVDQTIESICDIQKEKSCLHNYSHQIKTLSDVLAILICYYQANHQIDSYRAILRNTINSLEECDPLDHPKVLFLFLMLESLIPKQDSQSKDPQMSAAFKGVIPKISCSLIRIAKSVELGPSIHVFTRSGTHKSNRGIQCCTYANCIKIYTLIFLNYPAKVTGPFITDAMQICISSNLVQYSKYSTRLHSFFIHLASSISGLLKSICIGRKDEEMLQSSMPVFLSVFSHLIRCLILASDRQKLEDIPRISQNGYQNHNHDLLDTYENYEAQLKLLAIDIARALNTVSSLRTKMVDFAPHLISTYIKDIQRATCPDYVKLHLNEGIFRIFNLIDAHQKERREDMLEAGVQRKTIAGRASGSLFEMIHARLDQASREIFKDMHDNYNRFHRYLGKC